MVALRFPVPAILSFCGRDRTSLKNVPPSSVVALVGGAGHCMPPRYMVARKSPRVILSSFREAITRPPAYTRLCVTGTAIGIPCPPGPGSVVRGYSVHTLTPPHRTACGQLSALALLPRSFPHSTPLLFLSLVLSGAIAPGTTYAERWLLEQRSLKPLVAEPAARAPA